MWEDYKANNLAAEETELMNLVFDCTGISKVDFLTLVRAGRWEEYEPGHKIITEGEQNPYVYLISRGKALARFNGEVRFVWVNLKRYCTLLIARLIDFVSDRRLCTSLVPEIILEKWDCMLACTSQLHLPLQPLSQCRKIRTEPFPKLPPPPLQLRLLQYRHFQ